MLVRASVIALFVSLAAVSFSQETDKLLGKVTQVSGKAITIQLDTKQIPRPGDKLVVFVEIEGIGGTKVAEAKVVAVVDKMVMAEVTAATSKVTTGHLVKIDAKAPPLPPKQTPTKQPPKQTAPADQKLIQGVWKCVEATKDGKPTNQYVGVLAILQDSNLTWVFPRPDGTRYVGNASFKLGSSNSLKHFDWTPSGETGVHKRLYTLDGDTLKWSTNLGTKPRPESFEAGQWQFTCKRIEIPMTPGPALKDPSLLGDAAGGTWLGISRVGWAPKQVLLTGVIPNAPAAKGGLRKGDVLRSFDGKPFKGFLDFHQRYEQRNEGDEIVVELQRGDKILKRTVVLEKLPADGGIGQLRRLAELDVPWAQMDISVRYFRMRGIRVDGKQRSRAFMPEDRVEGIKWAKRSADNGNEWGCHFLAGFYAAGAGVFQDYAKAATWYRVGAEKGFPRSQYSLGNLYETGRGVTQNYAEAIKWYKSARQSNWRPLDLKYQNQACFALGKLHQKGLGFTQSDANAYRLFREAADRQHADSMMMVAWMLETGKGVAKDMKQAIAFYKKAADAGNEYSIKRLTQLGISR
jgi:uncharacterized protein (TIGR03067 family)